MKKYEYWGLSKKGEHWLSSSVLLSSSNKSQMDWAKRETDPSLFLLVYLPKNSPLWTISYSDFLDVVKNLILVS